MRNGELPVGDNDLSGGDNARYSCQQLPISEVFRVPAGIDLREQAFVSIGDRSRDPGTKTTVI